jgi:predicted ribosome quality control (RQC) complex YloA/Tae2 family protein
MFHNYFFLRRLAADLHELLIGKELTECFSQNKDELILGFADNQSGYFIKATLESKIGLLYFSDDFKRAKKNSVNLFEKCIGRKVIAVHCFDFERSFRIKFEDSSNLIFKMYGSRSNILYAEENQIKEIFKNNLVGDFEIIPADLNKPHFTKDRFLDESGDPQKTIPALGKEVNKYLVSIGYDQMDIAQKWDSLEQTVKSLFNNPMTILYPEDELPKLTLLYKPNESLWQTNNAIEAASKLYLDFTRSTYLDKGKQDILKDLNKKIKQHKNYLEKTIGKLDEVRNQRSHEETANIIMANLHLFIKGNSSLELHDFYTGSTLLVSLKPNISPQKHAEHLYRKSKNHKIQIQKLEDNIQAKQNELEALKKHRSDTLSIVDFKELKSFTIDKNQKSENQVSLPYHQYQMNGYDVLVGKNAKANDELTTRIAQKNDLWLHAKDVSGSHVVIRMKKIGTVPSNVLEFSAELAAWFSKRKTDSICPVIYTEKKYVRKIKGSPAGSVRVEKEHVIMVKPRNHPN